jgi:cell division protein FtsI (penicillin-binding protein 3)
MCSKIPGLRFSREQQRYYLNVGAQIIGFTDRDNHGISGLEKKYDKELKGRDGVRILQRSATGERYLAPDSEQIPPMAGQDLVLSIDADVQGILEEEITQALTDAKATAAMGIVMDVRSGEILAMANVPSFDMNSRNGVSSDAMRNRAITDMFEPGSTFKIIMAAGATERLGWNSSHMVDGHQGAIMLYGQPVRDHEPYGVMTFRKAITESSNVVAATTAMSIGAEGFYHYASAFGFGRKTGVGLIGESGGVLRSVSKWDRMTLPWMGYGYQVMATPLQVLQAYATLANDGARMRPFILKRIVDQDGKVISEIVPQKVTQAVKPETARYMTREYFRAVVEEGTGKAAAIVGIPVAGKTGTAQKLHNGSYQGWRYYLSSFVGFFPADNPQYAAIIVVDEPQTAYYASAVAAPFFSKICGRSLACSLEMQRRLKMNPPEKALLATISTVVVPDLRGLDDREAMRLLKWNGLEMQYQGKGAGYVLAQNVAPGSKVRRETKITVTLSGR